MRPSSSLRQFNRLGVTTFEQADQLVERLRAALLESKAPETPARYIFRGQGDASWGLVPSAFRSGTKLGYESQKFCRVSDGTMGQTWEQGNAELTAVMEFLQLANRVGLDIPIDHKWLREWNPFRNLVGTPPIGTGVWPPQEFYEALALAQHHGVPTRLLDFTYDPLVAAFFAACNPPKNAKDIAVWSVDIEAILRLVDAVHEIVIVTVSKEHNKNLSAQKGLFLLDQSGSLWRNSLLDVSPGGRELVKKYCLPACESANLLSLLGKLSVDRAHLMPSFDGVVRELEARRRRRRDRIPRIGKDA